MSDERYTVILGDRRYAIHRKWARLPAGQSFGFLSDLMVDGEGRVHVAQRGTDRPVLVFDRDGHLIGSWGEGALAEPHYINPAPDGSILVADRDPVFVTDQIARISLLDADGHLIGRCRGAINGAHGIAGDASGNLYLAELPPQEITKLEHLN